MRFDRSKLELTVHARRESRVGSIVLTELDLERKRYDGAGSQRVRATVSTSGDAVGVLPYDRVRDVVLLVEQLRPGAWLAHERIPTLHPYTLEIPAGSLAAGEAPEAVVVRELLEETGCHAKSLTLVARYLPDPAMTGNIFRLFAAEVDASECTTLAGIKAEEEDVRVHVLSRGEFLGMLDQHLLQDAATLIAAQWLRAQP